MFNSLKEFFIQFLRKTESNIELPQLRQLWLKKYAATIWLQVFK